MRTVFFAIYVGLTFYGLMAAIGQIGKPREPLKPGSVITSAILSVGFVGVFWYLWAT